MEPNFQTSFIPKKPVLEEHPVSTRPINFWVVLSIFILFTVLLATGALYFYQGVLNKNITVMQSQLGLAENSFEPSKITELQTLDKRLSAANQILANHTAVSPIFQELQNITLATVSYTKFSYALGTAGAPATVQMSGVALGYSSVALQSDLFAKDKNFIDPVFSNLALDTKGNVTFDLSFTVDPSFINYKQMLQSQSNNT